MKKNTLLLLGILLCSTSFVKAQSGLSLFDDAYVHEVRLYFDDPAFWDTLTAHYILDDDMDPLTENLPITANALIDSVWINNIGVKQKGYYSNWGAGESLKKPLKLDFNAFDSDLEYDDLKSLSLQNCFMDPSFMRDVLSYRILRDFGVAAPRTAYVRVYLNDQYWGLYVAVESVNKTFLKEHFGNNDGNLYKAGWTSMKYLGEDPTAYAEDFELKTNEDVNDWSRLTRFLKVINNTSNTKFKDSLNKYMAVDGYLRTLAVDVTTNNWDSHFDHGRNFYLYDSPEDGKFHWIPWDYNLAFAPADYDITFKDLRTGPGYDKLLPKKTLANTSLKQEYLNIACQLHHGVFTAEHLNPIIEQTKALIEAEVAADINKFYPEPEHFQLALEGGFSFIQVDSFHLIDSMWNGSMWVHTDTVFIWEYEEKYRGIKDMVSERNEDILAELSGSFGINFCVSPSIEPQSPQAEFSFRIWPNPASDWLQIKLPESGLISIYGADGRLLKRGEFDASAFKLSLTEYPTGTYWVEFASEHGTAVQKLSLFR